MYFSFLFFKAINGIDLNTAQYWLKLIFFKYVYKKKNEKYRSQGKRKNYT